MFGTQFPVSYSSSQAPPKATVLSYTAFGIDSNLAPKNAVVLTTHAPSVEWKNVTPFTILTNEKGSGSSHYCYGCNKKLEKDSMKIHVDAMYGTWFASEPKTVSCYFCVKVQCIMDAVKLQPKLKFPIKGMYY